MFSSYESVGSAKTLAGSKIKDYFALYWDMLVNASLAYFAKTEI